MEETYRRSLNKSVRKSIDDRFYPFLIVDQNNESLSHFLDLVEYAESHQFRVYFVELNRDVQLANQRNTHRRSLNEIEQVKFVRRSILHEHVVRLDQRAVGTITSALRNSRSSLVVTIRCHRRGLTKDERSRVEIEESFALSLRTGRNGRSRSSSSERKRNK